MDHHIAMMNPPLETLTFGIELEFICVRPEALFDPEYDSPYPGCPTDHVGAGPAIWKALKGSGIPAFGWEEDWGPAPVSHSCWRVEDDHLLLSEEEDQLLPEDWTSTGTDEAYTVECIELSSRKMRFFKDDWRAELATMLQVLREVESRGCRFITNSSTGHHVHVGFDGGVKVPLRTAKNIFQLFTAFERIIDELHASHRIELPAGLDPRHPYYPLSFFHTYGPDYDPLKGTKSSLLFDRLVNIEKASSYEALGAMFDIRRPDLIPDGRDGYICGHCATVNLDNLFPNPDMGRYAENLTGTIEFRQHTGTLDYLDIVAWTTLMCWIVVYASTTPTAGMLDLMIRGVDPGFGLDDFLSEIDCPEDVWDHYRNKGEAVFGVLPNIGNLKISNTNFSTPADALIEQNDKECEVRASDKAVRAAIDQKLTSGLYGIVPSTKVQLPTSIAAAELKKALLTAHRSGVGVNSEEGVSQLRAQVLGEFAQLYRAGKKFFSRG